MTALNNDPSAIDIYFVNKVFDDSGSLNGATILPSQSWFANPGIVIAGNSVDFAGFSPADKLIAITRTVAHELGHYLLNKDDSAHVDDLQNLMSIGASLTKRDFTTEQALMAQSNGQP